MCGLEGPPGHRRDDLEQLVDAVTTGVPGANGLEPGARQGRRQIRIVEHRAEMALHPGAVGSDQADAAKAAVTETSGPA